jgi:hypothetical protein
MSACHAQPLPARKQSLPARETALARLSPAQAQAATALALINAMILQRPNLAEPVRRPSTKFDRIYDLRRPSHPLARRKSTQFDTSTECRGRTTNSAVASNTHASVALQPPPDALGQLLDLLGLLDGAAREDALRRSH